MDLVEFLTARLAEDEAVARACMSTTWSEGVIRKGKPGRWFGIEGYCVLDESQVDEAGLTAGDESEVAQSAQQSHVKHIARHDPARVLREVAAKRALIAAHDGMPCGYGDNGKCLGCELLPILAGCYSDHPDYSRAIA